MEKPVLVVMAAGMGSRYGGLKQLDPVGPHNQLIMDYAIFDAKRAGFETVIFVIKPEIETEFQARIGQRLSQRMNVQYVYQQREDLPPGYAVPEGRTKPWGTAQAILSARHILHGPFGVINADDYYGPHGFSQIYDYFSRDDHDPQGYHYAMVGYQLQNTVTEHGGVARGICLEDETHHLQSITERTHIEKGPNGPRFTEDQGLTWTDLPGDTTVSMNLWGFTPSYLREAWNRFPAFLDETLQNNPIRGEYFLPTVVSQLIQEGKAQVQVLRSEDRWYGVTYQEDKPLVVQAIQALTRSGLYPEKLWEE